MPKASRDALKAKGKVDVYLFDPDDVVLVTDEGSALYDERVHNTYRESLVLNMMYAPDGRLQARPRGAGRREAEARGAARTCPAHARQAIEERREGARDRRRQGGQAGGGGRVDGRPQARRGPGGGRHRGLDRADLERRGLGRVGDGGAGEDPGGRVAGEEVGDC